MLWTFIHIPSRCLAGGRVHTPWGFQGMKVGHPLFSSNHWPRAVACRSMFLSSLWFSLVACWSRGRCMVGRALGVARAVADLMEDFVAQTLPSRAALQHVQRSTHSVRARRPASRSALGCEEAHFSEHVMAAEHVAQIVQEGKQWGSISSQYLFMICQQCRVTARMPAVLLRRSLLNATSPAQRCTSKLRSPGSRAMMQCGRSRRLGRRLEEASAVTRRPLRMQV